MAIQAAAEILKQTRTATIQGKAFHNTAITTLLLMTQWASGTMIARNDRTTNTLALTTHSRPLMPMYRLCTSCFHVDASNPVNPSSTITIARGIPTTSIRLRVHSITSGKVPESFSATGMATITSSHAARVLHIVALSLAAMSETLVSGRVAMNGVTPYESLPSGFDLLTVAATKAAMNGGVSSTPRSVSKTITGVSLKTKSKESSNGSRIATIAGSDRPCRRHSNHNCARAGEGK